jgi:O-antigen/teichoic acid export membrane protein
MRALSVRNLLYACCPGPLRPLWQRIEASDVGYRLARGTFWALAGTLIARALALLAGILTARIFGDTVRFGEFGIVRSTIEMLGVFAGFGLGLTSTKHVAEYYKTDPERAGRVLALTAVTSALIAGSACVFLAIAAPWLADSQLNAPHLASSLRLCAPLLFFTVLNGAQLGALTGFEAFRTTAYVNSLAGILAFPLPVLGAFFGGLNGSLWGLNFAAFFQYLIAHSALRRVAAWQNVKFQFAGFAHELPLVWTFSIPAALSGILVAPVNWWCNTLLTKIANGYSELGIYHAAQQWRLAIMFLPSILALVAMPMFSRTQGEGNIVRLKSLLIVNLALNAIVSAAIALPIVLFAPLIMSTYGPQYSNSSGVLVLLAIASAISATVQVVGQLIAAMGKMWQGFALNLVWAACFTAAAWWLYTDGARGLATANLLAYSVHLVTVGTYSWFVAFPAVSQPKKG